MAMASPMNHIFFHLMLCLEGFGSGVVCLCVGLFHEHITGLEH